LIYGTLIPLTFIKINFILTCVSLLVDLHYNFIMKIAIYIAFLSFGLSLVSFKSLTSTNQVKTKSFTDSIPEMNKQIIEFVNSKIQKKVGTGQCWDLAAEVLISANAKWNMKYVFGKEIDYKKEPVFPGDIIQLEGVVLNYVINGKKYTEKMTHHTAIIYEVKDKTSFTLAHQNTGYTGKKVGLSPLELTTLTKGKFKIYRPEK
jgi:hypothetical protein